LALPTEQQVESILARPYPKACANKINLSALESVEWLKAVILGVRRIRAEMDIPPSKMLDVLATGATATETQRFTEFAAILAQVGRIGSVTPLADHTALPEAAMTLIGALQIHIPLAGLIDKSAELARLAREMAKNEAELAKTRSKLDAPGFSDRAPPAVVAQERERAEKFAASLADLAAQRSRIERL
jgi:valyl-tRNA synthetase